MYELITLFFVVLHFKFYFYEKCTTGGNKIKNNGIDTFIKELERYKIEWNFKKSINDKVIILEVGDLLFHFNYDIFSYFV